MDVVVREEKIVVHITIQGKKVTNKVIQSVICF